MFKVVALTLPLKVILAASAVSVKLTVAASSEPLNVVPPVCVNVIIPRAAPDPTLPVTDTVPEPVLNVKLRAVSSLAMVDPKVTSLSVVVIIVLALHVTPPV